MGGCRPFLPNFGGLVEDSWKVHKKTGKMESFVITRVHVSSITVSKYIFFRENSLSSLSFHFFIYFLMKQKTQHTITNDNNNDNKVKIFSRVKISFCRKDTHTTKRI